MESNLDQLTPDQLETELVRIEQAVARLRKLQCDLIEEADRRQQPMADGCRTLVDWVASRLDVAHATARDLVALTRSEQADEWEGWSFDRQVALTRLTQVKKTPVDPWELAAYDLSGIGRLAAHHRRHTRRTETELVTDRHVTIQPTLEWSAWRMWGLFPATDGAVIEAALLTRADQLPTPPDGVSMTRGQRQADALTAICHDSLNHDTEDGVSHGSGATVTLVCDARDAAPTSGEAGVSVVGGPRVGPQALEEVLCDGTIDLIALTPDGKPLGIGQTSSTLPPRIRRFILARDGPSSCEATATSRRRREAITIKHRAWGGTDDTHNLTTLCWFHHHRVIHGYGYRIDPASPPHRRRLLPPGAESNSCEATASSGRRIEALTPKVSGIDPASPPMRRRLIPPSNGPP